MDGQRAVSPPRPPQVQCVSPFSGDSVLSAKLLRELDVVVSLLLENPSVLNARRLIALRHGERPCSPTPSPIQVPHLLHKVRNCGTWTLRYLT